MAKAETKKIDWSKPLRSSHSGVSVKFVGPHEKGFLVEIGKEGKISILNAYGRNIKSGRAVVFNKVTEPPKEEPNKRVSMEELTRRLNEKLTEGISKLLDAKSADLRNSVARSVNMHIVRFQEQVKETIESIDERLKALEAVYESPEPKPIFNVENHKTNN